MSIQAKQRHNWVDIAKGISIILVVMMHATFGVGEATERVGFMHYVLGFAAPFRMPEFFLISGLFLSAVIARPWRHYADRRIVHYIYFYALWAIILIGFKHLLVDRDPAGTVAMLASAIYEPYSILWFIYALAVFSLMAKLFYQARLPHWAVLIVAALCSIAPIHTPISILNYTASYFVYFYAGYALAPYIFSFADKVQARPMIAAGALMLWALLNAALVFAPGHIVAYGHIVTGIAHIPGATFALAIAGAMAVCAIAALIGNARAFGWLRWVGAHSIVIYLSFVIPMGIFRTLLLAVVPNIDAGLASLLVLFVAIAGPAVVYWIIGKIGFGRFLFERPAWAVVPGAPGSRWTPAEKPVQAPAE
ncbi:acyltransferase family protein [Pelagibacterium lentulum]|uniref:Acyltransferase n=1 Tax=Pelagibacterium lentulum TaxID=2029865 RepID=A0A916RB61_9HYPH|nr:acyltransferase family protein [Pelagibacterium lentulum]GGA48089.1 acyltransferase [Pelagibacterium lentulum]